MRIKIGIVVLNYNNLTDTLETIQSIIKCTNAQQHTLVVVDNNSTDGSWEALTSTNQFIASIIHVNNQHEKQLNYLPHVNLLQTTSNKGYAFGNNCGIQQCLLDTSITHIWILNNDVELDSNCLLNIEQSIIHSSESIGIWGTLLAYYHKKTHLQAVAAKYYPLIAKTKLFLSNFPINQLNKQLIEFNCKKANFFIGASLIFSRKIVEQIGLFNEQFFLYAEELDYFKRAKSAGFEKLIIGDAIVYHKEGGTTKLNGDKKKIGNTFIEFHNSRSKLIFTKIYYKHIYYLVYGMVVLNLFWVFRANLKNAIQIIKCLKKDVYSFNN
ncbi:MAG: glycosyltransferase family 2 protein [Chitinophagaceae bacterium]|jgi:hypothetical protein|nr:glycosyltransferase family 2 protein [Chitinophagaceae bacterium]